MDDTQQPSFDTPHPTPDAHPAHAAPAADSSPAAGDQSAAADHEPSSLAPLPPRTRAEPVPGPVPMEPPADEPLAIQTPEDILAYIPHALGEWPQESLVAVCLGDGRLGPTLRIDLPRRCSPARLARFADTVAGYVSHDRPAGAVLALYTKEAWSDPARPPHRGVVEAVVARLAEEGVPVLEVWAVGAEHWRTTTCADVLCCPWPGASIASLRESRVEAEMVYRGSSYRTGAVSEGPWRSLPQAAVSAAVEAYFQDPECWWDPYDFTAALAVWDEVLSGPDTPGPERLRLLAATLLRPALRDAVLVASAADAATAWRGSPATAVLRTAVPDRSARQAARCVPPALPGGVPAAEAAAALDCWSEGAVPTSADDGTGSEPPETVSAFEFGLVLMGCTGEAPAWDRIARLERVALELARMEEAEVRAPALAVLGWVQWARGRGGRCVSYLERALSADPRYRLAHLLMGLVQQGELAGWSRSQATAWRRASEAA